jgi:K+-transporting ATPase ATPase B chain
MDGIVVGGLASVDESAITGESAPVIRESHEGRDHVTGGTKVISDYIEIQISAKPGDTLFDRVLNQMESSAHSFTSSDKKNSRQNIQVSACALIIGILFAGAFESYAHSHWFNDVHITAYAAIAIAISALLTPALSSAYIPVAGITSVISLLGQNVLAVSRKAVESSCKITLFLLDKTGTITQGNRQAHEFIPVEGHSIEEVAQAALDCSLLDDTPEGRSIVSLATSRYAAKINQANESSAIFVPFTPQTRMSGVNIPGLEIRKGAVQSIIDYVKSRDGKVPDEVLELTRKISLEGGTPLLVSSNGVILGLIHLTDIIKEGLSARFDILRKLGIKTIMLTGDNPLTVDVIAQRAGVDESVAQSAPEDKMRLIKQEQDKGKVVAMVGDDTNDAPALAQADIGIAMNTGSETAKLAGNMIDLDSDPTKLIEIIEITNRSNNLIKSLTFFSYTFALVMIFYFATKLFSTSLPLIKLESEIISALIFECVSVFALLPFVSKYITNLKIDSWYMGFDAPAVWIGIGVVVPLPIIIIISKIILMLHAV